MSIVCPVCRQRYSVVYRCDKCRKVKCNSGAAMGSVKLGCVAKEPGVVAPGATHVGCGGHWQKYKEG